MDQLDGRSSVARIHPTKHQLAVQIETRLVVKISANVKRLGGRRDEFAGPAHRKSVGMDALRRRAKSPIKINFRVDAHHDRLAR